MITYEQLDRIADAYNPFLLLLLLFFIARAAYQKQWLEFELLLSSAVSGLGIVYSVMFIDSKMLIWAGIGLDYSTHTAFAVCIVLILASILRRFVLSITGSLLAYFLLMIYQEYHSLADIITTTIFIVLLLGGLIWLRKSSLQKVWLKR